MIDIKEFLKSKPLISINAIEKQCDIPHGTIRLNSNRPIPEKYLGIITMLLSDYLPNNDVTTVSKDIVIPVTDVTKPITSNDKMYFVKRINKDLILFNERKDTDKFDVRADIPEGSKLIVVA